MFGTSGIRGRVGSEVTADLALDVGRALATLGYDRVVVGRDARDSGRMLSRALEAGVIECGSDVVAVGVQSTPAIARAVEREGADAGVVVTASHNPPADNGIKLWSPSGQAFDEPRREAVADIVERGAFELAAADGVGVRESSTGVESAHAADIQRAVSLPADLSVVVDLGNGTGRVTADILHEYGCSVETLNGQRDGRFPGRPSEPTAENCSTVRTLVAETDADLGIAHDGDADRTLAIDETGRFVGGDQLLALFATRAASAGDAVAAPVNTSLAVADALDDVGAELVYTRVGDVFVAERARKADVVFGGEPSGAWIWPDRTLCPDGPLAACTLAAIVAEEGPLSTLVDDLPSYPIRRESVRTETKAETMARVETIATERYPDATTLDGVRIDTDEGWFLVRASGTQPLVRITAEGRTEAESEDLLREARTLVEEAS